MKKQYQMPTMKVVRIQHWQQLLSGSHYDNIQSPVETYNDDQDVINEKSSIW